MKILIDTNRYSDFMKRVPDAMEIFADADRICVPFVVLAELRAGFSCGTIAKQNEASLVKFLSNDRVEVLYVDAQTTQCYAQVFAQLRRQGTPIPTNDMWIAAAALESGAALATDDGHFAAVEILQVV